MLMMRVLYDHFVYSEILVAFCLSRNCLYLFLLPPDHYHLFITLPASHILLLYPQLREVEIKRLRVELQVSNLQQTLATIQSTQPPPFTGSAGEAAVEESLRRYESRLKLFTSQLNTPTSKLTLPRTVSDLTNNTFDYMPNDSFVLAARGQAVAPGTYYFTFYCVYCAVYCIVCVYIGCHQCELPKKCVLQYFPTSVPT